MILKMSMPSPSLGTSDGYRLHPICKRTSIYFLADPWPNVGLMLHVHSTWEPTCQTNFKVFLCSPIGPKQSPNSMWRSLCSLRCISNIQRWPIDDMSSIVSLYFKLGWLLSWTWMALSLSSSRCLLSLHCCWDWLRVYSSWSSNVASDTSPKIPSPWR